MLRKLFSCAAILLMSSAGAALAQGAASNPAAHETEVQRGAPAVDALNLLEAQGYVSFTNFREEGGGRFGADTIKDGQAVHVIIDPATRQIAVAGPAQNPQTMTGGAR